ncbi:uncharacterized protein LOC107412501 [Ziziphus jujuba]|uniref:non-specific serine/threonine protein kinase n=1 Tax=Ziziphus jujuba TaxID=326968 RepID=A0ABM3ZVD4_ZIZJJ|nr:interferon-induced, double-stranded RNA-activated protein kinase-like [Ziziphus jujuba var. spinosa]XP_060668432.1 uncharacterized protein LOC107412501 [Ziziphus jujuba]
MDLELLETRYEKLFEELEWLGRGGFGCVIKARHKFDGMEYAIKKVLIHPHNLKEEEDAIREVHVFSQLNHPNILRYNTAWIEDKLTGNSRCAEFPNQADDASSDEDDNDESDDGGVGLCLYIQMEVRPRSLKSELKIRRLERDEVYDILKQILMGLSYLHSRGVVHGDLTPSNIFIDKDNNIKLADFGLSKLMGEDDLSLMCAGAPPYIAPELLHGPCKPSPKLDIFNLGIIFFELLHFFESDLKSPRLTAIDKLRKNQEFPEGFPAAERNLIGRLVNAEPSQRPEMHEVTKEVEVLARGV